MIYSERLTFLLLFLWCILPILISFVLYTVGLLGAFPAAADLKKAGFQIGYLNYNITIEVYYKLFQVLGFVTFLYVVFHLLLSRKRLLKMTVLKSNPWVYLLLGLLLCTIASTVLSYDPFFAFFGGEYVHDGLLSYFIYTNIFLCASMIRKEKYRRYLLRVFTAVVSYLAIIMIIQELTRSPFLDYCFPSFRAVVFNQFNHFGYVLCMGILAFLGLYLHDKTAGRKLKITYMVGFCLLVFALLINDTFGAYLATAVAIPVVYIFYAKNGNKLRIKAFLPLIAFILVSALNILNVLPGSATLSKNLTQFGTDVKNVATGSEQAASAGTGRFTLWKDTLKRISEHPFFGYGPEGFYGRNAITNDDRPHNEYLLIAGYHGIPALIFYLSALITLAVHHWKRLKELDPLVVAVAGVTVGYLFSACFGNPVFNTVPFFWMFLGLTTATNEKTPPLICLEEA